MSSGKDVKTFRLGGELEVRRLGFGAMRITGKGIWGEPADREAAKRLLRRVVELGINLIDTADSYGPEVSERLIREALYPYPAGLVIATKGGLVRPGPDDWVRNGDPKHLRAACDASLQRLKLDRIDVYQLHAIDPRFTLDDQLGTLVELQRAGKIRHIGLSNVTAQQLERASTVATIVSVQNRYSLTDRASEPVLEACEKLGIGFIPWYPVAAGALTHSSGSLGGIARQRNATPAQVALAWLLARSPVMLPIPGTSSLAHLEENAGASELELDEADLRSL